MLRAMKLLMAHGYMLSGSGSNVYVQNLCRGLVKVGHDVHLLCREPEPLRYDFVNEHYLASERGVEGLGAGDGRPTRATAPSTTRRSATSCRSTSTTTRAGA